MNGSGRTSTTGSIAAAALRDVASGPVYTADDDGYDTARRPWSRAVNPSPSAVIEAAETADVQAAVRTAGEHDLPVAVQATGHGTMLPADGAILVNTAGMATVRVDPVRRLARVAAGATWNEVIGEAGRYGLAPLSGSSPTVGVVGYTLGGGHGWLSRTYGFAADSLVRADIVTGDGRLHTASADEDPDLHWALRGGGGNFGIVTSLHVRLYPVDRVYGGIVLFPIDNAADMLAGYQEWASDQPDEMNTALMMMATAEAEQLPAAGPRMLALRVCYTGTATAAERLLTPLREVAGKPLMDVLQEMGYAHLGQRLIDPPPPPQATHGHSSMFRELPDPAVDALLDAAGPPAEAAGTQVKVVEIRHFGGVMARPGPDAGPVGGRDASFCVCATTPVDGLDPPAKDRVDRHMDALATRLAPHATGGEFLNFLSDPANIAAAYTPGDYRRLQALKAVYDPDDLFGLPGPRIPPEP